MAAFSCGGRSEPQNTIPSSRPESLVKIQQETGIAWAPTPSPRKSEQGLFVSADPTGKVKGVFPPRAECLEGPGDLGLPLQRSLVPCPLGSASQTKKSRLPNESRGVLLFLRFPVDYGMVSALPTPPPSSVTLRYQFEWGRVHSGFLCPQLL